ncbi:MAG: DNA polymerase III subunit alpha [Candidatus Latescibacterota bacterium]
MENTCGFVHLHTHTEYSLLDGAIRVKDYVKAAKEWGMGACAITDHGNMFGAIDLYLKAKEAGIKAIIGSEVYVAIEGMRSRKAARGNNDGANHLVLLAADNQGYRNLMQLVSKGFLEGFYYKPRVDKPLLREYSQGIIAMSACVGGEIPQLILQGHPGEAEQVALEYVDIFGKDNFFIELHDHGLPEEKEVRDTLVAIARRNDIGLVASNDAHYLKADHADSHDVLLCISTGKTLQDENRMKMDTPEFYLKSPDEMKKLFAEFPDALENTVKIAERCDVKIQTGVYYPVKFDVPADFEGNTDDYLAHLAEIGLRERYGEKADEYRERMHYELGIIKSMGFSDYFLAIYDCTRAAREMGIPVGTARGSAGGSIVAYAVGITNLDPMAFGLIFERFLNPERVSMPDFDVDYADRDRARMIEYVKQKYGEDHVCQIITFGSMKAKLVVRDVARVLNLPYAEADILAKLIPNDLGTTLESAFETVPELRDAVKANPVYAELFRHARVLEGLNRHAGTHAAGVIITPGPSTEYLPLYKQGEDITSQYTMEFIEKIGCLKVDFLGLRTLTVIKDAVDMINAAGGNLDISAIPMDDPDVYHIMGQGETTAIFQFESSGMRDYLRKLKPTCIEDLIAMNALYRPGPLGSNMVDDFIQRKHGIKEIRYSHPLLEPVLKETYGVIVYQEQVMKIANVLAGFSLGGADELRRAMGKKKADVMAKMKNKFITGALDKGIAEKVAEEVFDLMAYFAGYGFNKSHSAGYAILAYQTAWLKAKYPAQLMAATLTSEMNDTDRVVLFIEECRRMGIEVLPPDINCSMAYFTVENGNVRFGLGAVKNVGLGAIEAIVTARNEGGPFRSLFVFCTRVDLKALNKRVFESLIMAGAMDCLDHNRAKLLTGVDRAIEHAQAEQREKEMGQFNLFGNPGGGSALATPTLPEIPAWNKMEMLAKEKSVLGFWFSGHPLEGFQDELRAFATPFRMLVTRADRETVMVGGVVTSVTRKTSKKNDKPLLIAKIEDLEGSGEVIFMNGAFDDYKEKIIVDAMVLVEGTVSTRGDSPSVWANKVEELTDSRTRRMRGVTISLTTLGLAPEDLDSIIAVCEKYPGELPLTIRLETTSTGNWRIKCRKHKVSSDPRLVRDLRKLLGKENVWIG